jgi:DNA polymerase III delta subunit
MPEIDCQSLDAHIDGVLKGETGKKEKRFAPVYLIHGDEYLYKEAFGKLLGAIIPDFSRSLNYERLEGGNENIPRAIEKISTFSFMPGRKAVAICDSRVFDKKQAPAGLPEKEGPEKDGEWGEDLPGMLREAIERGFLPDHHLILTADAVDRRTGFYKSVKKAGMAIDCSVPKGVGWADRKALDSLCRAHVRKILARHGKKAAPKALGALIEMTGLSLRLLSGNAEKLIDYSGNRETILESDVAMVLKQTRIDPVYELTNAVAERDAPKSLFFLDALVPVDMHPLQALMAMANQVRKLLMAKAFMESPHGRVWERGMPYGRFKDHVMSGVAEFDAQTAETVAGWEKTFLDETPGKKKKRPFAGDLAVAKNPRNPYPVYQTFLKAERFDKKEIIAALKRIAEADSTIKSGGGKPRLELEKVVWFICLGDGDSVSLT